MFAIHEYMTLATYNQKLSLIIDNLKSFEFDLFVPERKQDYFDRYQLRKYLNDFMSTLKTKILLQVKMDPISEVLLIDQC